mgnify:FL=1
MEEKEIVAEEATNEEIKELEVQNTFNTDSIDVLVESEDCIVENQEEVE